MRWSVVSGGAWLAGFLIGFPVAIVLQVLNVPFGIIRSLGCVYLLGWGIVVALSPLGLAYGSFLTVRSLRQRENPWQRSDSQDAVVVNVVAWIFGGVPSLIFVLICLAGYLS